MPGSSPVSGWFRQSAGSPETQGYPAPVVKIYAVILVTGIVGLIVLLLGGALAENTGHPERDPGARIGLTGKSLIGAAVGFGMAGMSAEFSPLDFSWQVGLLIACVAAGLSVLWVRYAAREAK